MKNNFYVYLHINKLNGNPFYVGKGTGDRCNNVASRNNYWKNTVNLYGYDILLLEENLSEEKSFELEKYWINRIGRKDLKNGLLVNNTNGGEGSSGYKHRESSRIKMSESRKGIPTSVKQKEKVGKIYRNKFGSDHNRSKSVICVETRNKYGSMSEASRELNIHVSSVSWSITHGKPIFGMHFEIAK